MNPIVTLIFKLLDERIRQDIVTAIVLSLKRNDKFVSGETAASIFARSKFSGDNYSVLAGGNEVLRYIVEGKPAGTKLPMRLVNGEWELMPPLARWKAIRGVTIPDYLLARSIAENERKGVDIAAEAIRIFNKESFIRLNQNLRTLVSREITRELKVIYGELAA